MTVSDIRTLLDYHYWARDRALDAVAQLTGEEFVEPRGSSFSSIRDTLAHTFFAEWAWYSRWTGTSPAGLPALDRFSSVETLRAAWREQEQLVRGLVDSMSDDDVQKVVEYRLFSGAAGASPMWQMVQHVVNHAAYHRGQVTTLLRQAGAQPAKSMDLIAFYRERQSAERGS